LTTDHYNYKPGGKNMSASDTEKNQNNNEVGERRHFLAKMFGFLAGVSLIGGASKLFAQVGKKNPASINGVANVQGTSPYLGEIDMVAFNFAPTGWALCEGQLLPISEYDALFNLIGTTYGGNGQTTFALPDLRGRVPVAMGQGYGLSNYVIGQYSGAETVTLNQNQIPAHTHAANASTSNGTSATPSGNFPAVNNEGIQHYAATSNGTMNATAIGNTGGGQAHSNLQPSLCINFIIALTGVYPTS
jgi:microcystin-dependent protein